MKFLYIIFLILGCTHQINSSDLYILDQLIHEASGIEEKFLSGKADDMDDALKSNVHRNCTDRYGNTALHLAAYRRNFIHIQPLIEVGVNPDIKNNYNLSYIDILNKNTENVCINLHEIKDKPCRMIKPHKEKTA